MAQVRLCSVCFHCPGGTNVQTWPGPESAEFYHGPNSDKEAKKIITLLQVAFTGNDLSQRGLRDGTEVNKSFPHYLANITYIDTVTFYSKGQQPFTFRKLSFSYLFIYFEVLLGFSFSNFPLRSKVVNINSSIFLSF